MLNSLILTLGLVLPWGIGPTAIAQSLPSKTPILVEVTTPETIDIAALITHLQSINARMYGAYWCSHCTTQKELFGDVDTLMDADIYVECAQGGPHRATPWLCNLYRIEAYPTWIIGGDRYVGVHSLEQLAEFSGFTNR